MRQRLFVTAAAILALAASPALAVDNYPVKDGTGAAKTMRAKDVGAGILAPTNTIADSAGTLIDPAKDTSVDGLEGLITTGNGSLASILAAQATAAKQDSLIALFPTSLGSKAAANSFAITLSTENVALLGGLTETAPATDTASSGLNGRLQRMTQKLTLLEGYLDQVEAKVDAVTTAVNTLNSNVTGDTANGAANTDKATTQGGTCRTADPTTETAGDKVEAQFDCNGKSVTSPYANSSNLVSGVITSPITGTTSASLVAAPGSGLRNYITEISCVNTHATVDTLVNIEDGSEGTVIAQLFAPHGQGHQKQFPAPLRQPTANTALHADDATTGASVTCSATGFKAP